MAHAVEGSLQTEQYWAAGPAADRTTLLYAAAWCLLAVVLVLADRRLWWPPQDVDRRAPVSHETAAR